MLEKLGAIGVLGIVVILGGLGLIAWADPVVAAGMALVLFGFGLTVKALVSNLLSSFGMGGMM
ncbi:hypothetical protein G9464_00205 [Halostella sp. JP-L12]|uniref:DUF7470 family protein n=1 Tax=Halostella TaxID=1843185 RepID=UPI000EF84B54|nr:MULTISPECIES: hypothetical protein [Halostella]NHN46018.1 hypothetical protein [Halostella sp. JP-L12]